MRRRFSALILSGLATLTSAQEVTLTAPDADDDLRNALRASSLTFALQRDENDAPQDYIAAARADYRRLLTGLYAQGYYSGTISILVDGVEAASIDPLTQRNSLSRVELIVTPGPRFTFGRADIAPLAPGTELPEAFATGQTARSDVISDAARTAVEGWRNAGHPLAEPVDQSVVADHPAQQLDVALRVAPGPELSFGTVTIDGAENVRPERIRAIAGIPALTYDPALIRRAEENLRRTGAFSSATVTQAETADGNTLPLTISVVEQTPRRIGFGAEYSSVSGLTLSSYWMHRNLLGGAERFRVEAEVTGLSGGTGGLDYSLTSSFLRPATFREDTDFYANGDLSRVEEPNYREQDIAIEAGIIRRLWSGTQISYGLGYMAGEVEDDLGSRNYSLVYADLEGIRDRRDSRIDPTSGSYAQLKLTPFAGQSDTDSGARLVGDGRYYHSFGANDRVTLAFRGQIGAVFGANAERVPASYLFYSGGGGTVRGQPYQSLGVDLGGGNTIGGLAFLGTQLEARVGVTDKIGIVGFYDTGFIGPEAFDLDSGDWHSGAGLGLRYDTGIGPIRLDLATPASGPEAGKSLEIYIGIGQAF